MPDYNTCCGFAAALLSIVAFGSFAVPIKCQAARKVAVDPLVLQTYKIGACFVTSWFVLLIGGVKFAFTPYGFVSGLLMVPGGTAGYYGVRNAGLAVSQGIWSSLKVLVAFAWGLFIFREPVQSKSATAFAVLLMLVGLAGMSFYAAPMSSSNTSPTNNIRRQELDDQQLLEEPLLLLDDDEGADETIEPFSARRQRNGIGCITRIGGLDSWYLGILGAVIDGLYGGSVLVPMHFAKMQSEELQGLGYLISFAIGCASVVSLVWLGRWILCATQESSLYLGWKRLPSFHISTIGPYGILAGLVWSIGNVSSIVSVAILGQGLGYSLVQSQLVVAGIWAVFFYGEIQGLRRIIIWFGFAAVTVFSIILLSQQHRSMPMEESSSARETGE